MLMITWRDFAHASPALATIGERMLRINKDKPAGSLAGGLAYLATIRKDGGPRIHPISPALIDGRLYAFILNHSPKQHDLLRDGRYALHSWPYPMDEQNYNDDEFYLSGTATFVDDSALLQAVAQAIGDNPDEGAVFELGLERVLHKGRVQGRVVYTTWTAGS
jgi:Pyridoxamine 5'-phosphate oxidase